MVDGNGFLDIPELKIAFKRAILASRSLEGATKEIDDRAARLTELGARARRLAESTLDLETEEGLLKTMKAEHGTNLEQKLGSLFAARNATASDLTAFDGDNNSVLDKKEFKAVVNSSTSGDEVSPSSLGSPLSPEVVN